MSRRIDIELTSARPDGTWTWRAAGAREPKGVLAGSLLPAGITAGAVLKAEAEMELDGITILSVAAGKEKVEKTKVIQILASDKPFEGVTSQLARRDRSDRGDRGDRRDRPPRRFDGDGPRREPRRDGGGGDRPGGDRPGGDRSGAPRPGIDARRGDPRGSRSERPGSGDRRGRPSFAPPPEMPLRPKAKRLKPGRTHRSAVLADLPEAQRAVAERALQGGIPAVRQAVSEQNARLKAEGHEQVPAAGLLAMAEQLLPRLRVAEWLDRADAAKADLEELDLRDLRSVVAASEDPMVARDESTRAIAAELKVALVTKQDKELSLWLGDIEAAVGLGRVVRALKLSSQPPKAGVRFPVELAGKLAGAATANLGAEALPDRWVAVLEAAAFSPVRSHVRPADKPQHMSDELTATVKRLAPLLPQVAELFGIEVAAGKAQPKPLRPTRPGSSAKSIPAPPPPRSPKAGPKVTPEAQAPVTEVPAVEAVVEDPPVAEAVAVVEDPPVAEAVAVVEDPPVAEAVAVVEDPPVAEAVAVVDQDAPVAEVADVDQEAPAIEDVPPADVAESAETESATSAESSEAESSEAESSADVSVAEGVAEND